MKIAAILSRYTANRDIIEEDFGRQMRLLEQLQKKGHSIVMICADYKKNRNEILNMHGMKVISSSFSWRFPLPFAVKCYKTIKTENPELIIAATEPIWGILGYIIAKRFRKPLLYDIHDNFKIYDSYKIPLMDMMDGHVMRKADKVTVASDALLKYIPRKDATVINNGYDKRFKPLNQQMCRAEMKLPKKAKIIAYIGSIQKLQGIEMLIKAAQELKKEIPELQLLLAGRIVTKNNQAVDVKREGVNYIGSIPQDKVPAAINSADVMVMPYPLNEFTKAMQTPYKLVEYMACEKPIVITEVGTMKELAGKYVAKPGDKESLKQEIRKALNGPERVRYAKTREFSWEEIGKKLDRTVLGPA